MSDDVAKVADKLNPNMAHAIRRTYKGGIQCDVPTSTVKALVKRGLAEWDADDLGGSHLTPLGLVVHAHLNAKAETAEQEEMERLAEKFAAERKIRDEGYRDGQSVCARQLYEAVYPGDSWPDRPLDTIWEHLVEKVRKEFKP